MHKSSLALQHKDEVDQQRSIRIKKQLVRWEELQGWFDKLDDPCEGQSRGQYLDALS